MNTGISKNFPADFIWGTATAAYQIEGAAFEAGKGLSIWDNFCREPGRIFDGSSGDIACDHYNRFEEDFALMASLNIRDYRFSVSWPRLLPDGTGQVNQKGIDFYDRLIDSMMSFDITPHMTLFHWDYPYELFRRGGWLSDDSSDWFADYAALIAKHFGDRVKSFFTLNEPQCFIGLSCYPPAIHAPGISFSTKDALLMTHNVLLAHGKSVMALRNAVPGAVISCAATGSYFHPDSNTPNDIEAARTAQFDAGKDNWAFSVAWWNDPLFFGKYPEKAFSEFEEIMPNIKADDMKIISQPLDRFGFNIYRSAPVRARKADAEPIGSADYEIAPFKQGHPKTCYQWQVTPECLYWAAKFLYERYDCPLLITENGLSAPDSVSLDGNVHDSTRIDFIQKHLLALRTAIAEGADVRGFFHWSFLDNFEWNRGYDERFGLVYVDYETQRRIPKDSARYYKKIIQTHGMCLDDPWGIKI